LTRVSIDLQKLIFLNGWMAGSSPAMTQLFEGRLARTQLRYHRVADKLAANNLT
jgi:hypothetical protein